jgi:hypothetical protein
LLLLASQVQISCAAVLILSDTFGGFDLLDRPAIAHHLEIPNKIPFTLWHIEFFLPNSFFDYGRKFPFWALFAEF